MTGRSRWEATFGRVAFAAFASLLVTGLLEACWLSPSMADTVYRGSYAPLDGVHVSRAYASTLHLSFDVPGGLLIRQVHQWSVLLLTAAIALRILTMFLTGTYRRPRAAAWLTWVALFPLAMAEGVMGTILPDDMLSGGSVRLIQGVTQSIPLVGTRLTLWLFGGDIPGRQIIPLFYWLHLLVVPVVLGALFLYAGRLDRTAGDRRLARAETVATSFTTAFVLLLLGTFAQVSPVWLYGPSRPDATTAGAVPDWYMGFLDGGLRLMPGWEPHLAGHPLTLSVLIPGLLLPGVLLTLLAGWPVLERRLAAAPFTPPVRPRETPARTGAASALITLYGLLWAASANDQIAFHFHLPLYAVTWFFRIAVLTAPLAAYAITRLFCQGFTDTAQDEAAHGHETGTIVMDPSGGFHELRTPPPPSRYAVT